MRRRRKMRRQKMLVLTLLALGVSASAAIWIGSNFTAQGQSTVAQQARNGSISQRRLGIEIGLTKSFTVAAATAGHTVETFLRVPVRAAGEKLDNFSAIKLAPKIAGD